MQFSLYAEELSETVEKKCTAEWVQSTYYLSMDILSSVGCFCTPFWFFSLSHFVPCVLFLLPLSNEI